MEFVLTELIERVMTARAAQRPVHIRGGGTKDFYGEPGSLQGATSHSVLDMSAYHGVVNYQPAELVLTVRAGTRLAEVERLLDEHGQMLAFEPPRFGPESTVGGCVAAGLSGPRRAAAGSLRDFILGTKLLDSSGSVLEFGGEVMKNVAGYDVSRLLAGSMGIFGALVEVSIKVVPKPLVEKTHRLDVDEAEALALFSQWRGKPLPVSATAWVPGEAPALWVRLSGSAPAVEAGARVVGGAETDSGEAVRLWDSLRDHTHPLLRACPLWRLAVPPQTSALGLGPSLIEWNGGQRWLAQPLEAGALRERVARLGGHATLFRQGADNDAPVFHSPAPGLMAISRRLKHALDPVGIFNPKRLFSEF